MAGENSNYPSQPYNLEQLGIVTEDTGGGVYAIRTTGGGGGGGDATAANQATQIAAEQATANSVSNIEGINTDIRNSSLNIETATASIQATNSDIKTASDNILSTVTDIKASCGNIETYTGQLKGSLVIIASVRWNNTLAGLVPSSRMVVAFINRATGDTVNPYTLSAGAQAHLIASEKFAACQTPNSIAVITYTNCVSFATSRTYTAADAGGSDIDIYYAGAH